MNYQLCFTLIGAKEMKIVNLDLYKMEKLKKKIHNLDSVEINRPRIGGCIFKGD